MAKQFHSLFFTLDSHYNIIKRIEDHKIRLSYPLTTNYFIDAADNLKINICRYAKGFEIKNIKFVLRNTATEDGEIIFAQHLLKIEYFDQPLIESIHVEQEKNTNIHQGLWLHKLAEHRTENCTVKNTGKTSVDNGWGYGFIDTHTIGGRYFNCGGHSNWHVFEAADSVYHLTYKSCYATKRNEHRNPSYAQLFSSHQSCDSVTIEDCKAGGHLAIEWRGNNLTILNSHIHSVRTAGGSGFGSSLYPQRLKIVNSDVFTSLTSINFNYIEITNSRLATDGYPSVWLYGKGVVINNSEIRGIHISAENYIDIANSIYTPDQRANDNEGWALKKLQRTSSGTFYRNGDPIGDDIIRNSLYYYQLEDFKPAVRLTNTTIHGTLSFTDCNVIALTGNSFGNLYATQSVIDILENNSLCRRTGYPSSSSKHILRNTLNNTLIKNMGAGNNFELFQELQGGIEPRNDFSIQNISPVLLEREKTQNGLLISNTTGIFQESVDEDLSKYMIGTNGFTLTFALGYTTGGEQLFYKHIGESGGIYIYSDRFSSTLKAQILGKYQSEDLEDLLIDTGVYVNDPHTRYWITLDRRENDASLMVASNGIILSHKVIDLPQDCVIDAENERLTVLGSLHARNTFSVHNGSFKFYNTGLDYKQLVASSRSNEVIFLGSASLGYSEGYKVVKTLTPSQILEQLPDNIASYLDAQIVNGALVLKKKVGSNKNYAILNLGLDQMEELKRASFIKLNISAKYSQDSGSIGFKGVHSYGGGDSSGIALTDIVKQYSGTVFKNGHLDWNGHIGVSFESDQSEINIDSIEIKSIGCVLQPYFDEESQELYNHAGTVRKPMWKDSRYRNEYPHSNGTEIK
ncbi:hypothetical protein FUAX_54800 (plasmid) [Fulvitalea axinellae]|uniref:Uncharacterized protein n=1 Tax=Fulvitalea axinellae TaxID=1182444 RepID=A0AAU9CSF9_9BACT|nr:hypothetical protein FUAX_54800 [Fulvitalea axinellae]